MKALLAAPLLLLVAAQDSPVETTDGPDYHDAPEMAVNPAQPMGSLHAFVMRSEESAIYPGIRQLQNDVTARRDAHGNRIAAPENQQSEPAPYRRDVFVYLPAGAKPGALLPFMVVQDGPGYAARVSAALDSLIAQHRVPAMAAVNVGENPMRISSARLLASRTDKESANGLSLIFVISLPSLKVI